MPLTGYALGGSSDIVLEDMQRVEVLRGPQGTLYGSNSLSGAIRYIPQTPTLEHFEGNVKAGYSGTARYGGDNTVAQGVVNIPIVVDKFAIRALAYRHEREGYYRNVAGSDPAIQAAAAQYAAQALAIDRDNVGDTTYTGGRLSALWKPLDRLNITFTYLKQRTEANSPIGEQSSFGPYTRSTYQFGDPVRGRDPLAIDVDIFNLVGELDVGFGKVLSSSAWIDQHYQRNLELSAISSIYVPSRSNVPITQLSFTDAKVFVQELRLTSQLNGPFGYIFGFYYEDSEQPTGQPTYYTGDPARNPAPAMQLWDLRSNREVTQKAAFGELSYQITDQLKATVGGRVSDYDTTFRLRVLNSVTAAVPNSDWSDRRAETPSTYKVGLEYKPTTNSMIYASRSEGFRLGRPLNTTLIRSLCDRDQNGFLDGTEIPSSINGVSSDTLASYELGGKLTILDGRGTLNLAVYDNDWIDIPVNVRPPGCGTATTLNGGKARARGIELESLARVFENLRFGIAVGYVDAELSNTTLAGNKGDRVNFTPKINGSTNLEYDFQLAGRDAFVRADYTYFGNYFAQTGERGLKLPGYGLLGLSTGMTFGPADVQLRVTNLSNTDAFETLSGTPVLSTGTRVRPRTAGVFFNYRF